ncbi:MAG: Stealth CR1 domain-containing protein [Porphyromonadaceae bacterium]|nr:Stealth CR1 domain-containing protein [Porphyromonadaceae bacterium]
MDIDFVITWVDMNSPKWREEFAKYQAKEETEKNGVSQARFRDNGLLKYWFRGVDRFAPWVRRIHFITCGQTPDWLDVNNPKLHLVDHREIIPEQFLPTFNSVVIERYIHKIPSLAEHFVYFNDDFYLTNFVGQERFFKDGLPCDIAAFSYNPSWSQWYKRIKNNSLLINRHFDKKEVMRRYHDKWFDKRYGGKAVWNYLLYFYGQFIPLRTPHNAQPYLKTTFDEVWDAMGKELTETSSNRFRVRTDLTPELFRTWQICRGNFSPYNTYTDTKMFPLMIRPRQAVKAVRNQSYKLVCLNDNVHIRHYDAVLDRLRMAFEEILPEKSGFEI